MYDTAERLQGQGDELCYVLTAKEAPKYKRTADDFRLLAERYNLPFAQSCRIDWHQTALNIQRLINASNKPYAGVFCDYEGDKLIIWDAELVNDSEVFCAVLGQVTKIGAGFVEVTCGEGLIS